MFGGAATLAQSVEILNALITAEERLKQGERANAFEPLKAILSKTSTESKNMALARLVNELLENRRSGGAVVAAQAIDDEVLRNGILLDILQRQCYAARPEQSDLMIGKARETATLLTGEFRDRGYATIEATLNNVYWARAFNYARARKFDLASESVKEIEDAERRDSILNGVYQSLALNYAGERKFDLALEAVKQISDADRRDNILIAHDRYYGRNLIQALTNSRDRRTPEDEKIVREMVALVQAPLLKAMALVGLSDFYDGRNGFWSVYAEFNADERGRKCSELLQEATKILLLLPNDVTRCGLLIDIYHRNLWHNQHTEAENVLKVALESIANIEDNSSMFHHYRTLVWSHTSRQPPPDVREQMLFLIEKTDDPKIKAEHWRWFVMILDRGMQPSTSEERTEALNNAREAFANIGDKTEWARLLLNNLTAPNNRDEIRREEALLRIDEAAQFMLAHANEAERWHDDGRRYWEKVIEEYAHREQVDKMLAFVHSPRIPPDLQRVLYFKAALDLFKTRQFESRIAEYQKLYGLLSAADGSPISNAKIQVLYQHFFNNSLHFAFWDDQRQSFDQQHFRLQRVALIDIDWEELVVGALKTRGDSQFTSACQYLAQVIAAVRHGNESMIDAAPLLVLVDKKMEEPLSSYRRQALEWLRNALTR